MNTTEATTIATIVRHCYCPLRIHTPYTTLYLYIEWTNRDPQIADRV